MTNMTALGRKRKSQLFQKNTAYTSQADDNFRVQKARRIGPVDPGGTLGR
jgi:hypothetical protein